MNTSPFGNGLTYATGTYLTIGDGQNSTGTVTVTGDGTWGSAQLVTTGSSGITNSRGGTGILNIANGGLVEANEGNIYLGTQGLADTPGSAITTIDGQNAFDPAILRTQQSSEGETWGRDGGRIYVGFGGQSNSVVNIINGGGMEALNGNVGDSGDDGSIWIGTSADAGSTAIVNVDGDGSWMVADNYIEVGGRSAGVTAELSITNGGYVEVTNGSASDPANTDMYVSAFPVDGEATVNVNGGSLAVDQLQIGGTARFVGYTADGVPVNTYDYDTIEVGQQVTDENGNLLFDREGSPVLAEEDLSWGGVVLPSTLIDGNGIYLKKSGSVVVENGGRVFAQTIDVSENDSRASAYNGQGATLTVRNGGNVYGDVNVCEGGILNGDGGAIHGDVFVDGGILAPGNSPGTLWVDGNLDLLSGALELEIGDLLNVSGDLMIGSDFMISLLFDFDPGEFVLNLEDFFSVLGVFTIDSGFDLENNLIIDGLGDNSNLTVSFFGSQVTYGDTGGSAPVPEPSTMILLGAGLSILFFNRRKIAKKQ